MHSTPSHCITQEDWDVDSDGHATLSEDAFRNSMFELADIWTATVSAEEYIEFLEKLLKSVADRNGFKHLDGTCEWAVGSDVLPCERCSVV